MGEALKRGFQIQVQTDYFGNFSIVMELEGRSLFLFFSFFLTELGRLVCVGAQWIVGDSDAVSTVPEALLQTSVSWVSVGAWGCPQGWGVARL